MNKCKAQKIFKKIYYTLLYRNQFMCHLKVCIYILIDFLSAAAEIKLKADFMRGIFFSKPKPFWIVFR